MNCPVHVVIAGSRVAEGHPSSMWVGGWTDFGVAPSGQDMGEGDSGQLTRHFLSARHCPEGLRAGLPSANPHLGFRASFHGGLITFPPLRTSAPPDTLRFLSRQLILDRRLIRSARHGPSGSAGWHGPQWPAQGSARPAREARVHRIPLCSPPPGRVPKHILDWSWGALGPSDFTH